jgi:hypothetical protein
VSKTFDLYLVIGGGGVLLYSIWALVSFFRLGGIPMKDGSRMTSRTHRVRFWLFVALCTIGLGIVCSGVTIATTELLTD